MRTNLPWLAAALLWSVPASAESRPARIHIDVFGSRRVSAEDAERVLGTRLQAFRALRLRKDESAARMAAKEKTALEKRLLGMGDFAWAEIESLEQTASDGTADAYFLLELVERKDRSSRLPFLPSPARRLRDPGGLLAAWTQYSDAGAKLSREGEVGVQTASCSAFYCVWGAASPQLKDLDARFAREVPSNREGLEAVLRGDADAARRASALYLLAYLRNGPDVVELGRGALRDADSAVRQAALRILGDVALRHPEVPVPIEALTEALAYPFAEDRTQALAAILSLSDKPAYRPYLIAHAADQVLSLLSLQWPSNHQMAQAVLGLLSGESHGERDYDAWAEWLVRARAALNETKEPKK